MKKFLPGLRIIKTFIAVLICFMFFYFFDYYNPIYATIACILMMKTTSAETKSAGINRMKGTLLGGFLSLITLLLMNQMNISKTSYWAPVMMSLALVVSLMICKGFEQDPYVASMSGVVLLITLVSHSEDISNIFSYVSIRMIETLIGILIAFVVNRYFDFNFVKKHFE